MLCTSIDPTSITTDVSLNIPKNINSKTTNSAVQITTEQVDITDLPPLAKDKALIITATGLTHWFPERAESKCKALLSPMLIKSKGKRIELKSKVRGSANLFEQVSELNGLAIPAMLEVQSKKTCSMYNELLKSENVHPKIMEKFKNLCKPTEMHTPAHFLELAAVYQAGAGLDCKGYISKVLQFNSFDWMSAETADQCLSILQQSVIGHESALFEYFMNTSFDWNGTGKIVEVQGLIDILTTTTLWEIKCVKELSSSHFLQLAIYAWLWRRTKEVCTFFN
jgi:hypothetical protein